MKMLQVSILEGNAIQVAGDIILGIAIISQVPDMLAVAECDPTK